MRKGKRVLVAGIAAAAIGALAATGASAHDGKRGYGYDGGHMMGHGMMGKGMMGGQGMHHGRMGKRHGGWGGHGGYGMRNMMKSFAKRYDANKDGQISQEEIDTNRNDWHKKFDADGDGNLSLKEFESLWLEAKRRQMVREFQRIDEDGSAGVSLEEYTEPMADFVERMDRNADGVLSRDDHRRWRKGMRHRMKMQGGYADENPQDSENSQEDSSQ